MEHHEEQYLSEEELERLIFQVEQESMLQAPSYLKEEILTSLAEQDAKMKQLQKKAEPNNRSRYNRQLWFYSAKVAIGAAAALFMLWITPANLIQPPFASPVQEQGQVLSPEQTGEETALAAQAKPWEKQESLSREEWESALKENVPQPSALSVFLSGMNEAAGKVCQGLSDTSGMLIRKK